MKIYEHGNEDISKFTTQEVLWIYNGLDCCVTEEIYEKLRPQVEKRASKTYNYERAMLGPAMTMMRRGVLVDPDTVESMRAPLLEEQAKLYWLWGQYTEAVLGERINPDSPVRVNALFYEALDIKPYKKRKGNGWTPTTDKEALVKIAKNYPRGQALANCLLGIRDVKKQLDVLNSKLSPNGRLRTSFNVAGTETWRWSSSESSLREGGNLQNVTERLRKIVVPDPGYKMFYADLDQAESVVVAYVSGDEGYINACNSGDLHTSVCKMLWPHLEWTGDKKADRALADTPYLFHFSYRDLAKRAGHGTNYGLSPKSLQNKLGLKLRDAWRFYLSYLGGVIEYENLERWHEQDSTAGFDKMIEAGFVFGEDKKKFVEVSGAFPGIRKWHTTVARTLETEQQLTTPFGMTRTFWNNASSSDTVREAIAFVPQSTVGTVLNIGMYRVWKELDNKGIQILANVHDAILGQVSEDNADELMKQVTDLMSFDIPVNDKIMRIGVSAEIGMNWGHASDTNPNGLKGWSYGNA